MKQHEIKNCRFCGKKGKLGFDETDEEVCDGYHKYTGNYNTDALRTELVHVAAVAVAWIEDIDRKSQEESGSNVFECKYKAEREARDV